MNNEIAEAIEKARAAYNVVAAAYDAVTSEFQGAVIYPRIISAIEAHCASLAGLRVLDLGCGSGGLIKILHAQGAIVAGVDISATFIARARSQGLPVYEASMHSLPFPDHSFDAIVSNFAINYLPPSGQRMALEEALRVLRPRGICVISLMHPWLLRNGKYFEPEHQKTIVLLGEEFTLHILDWPEIINMFVESGFIIRTLIDADIPQDLDQIAAHIQNPGAAQFAKSFAFMPYGMFVVAAKP